MKFTQHDAIMVQYGATILLKSKLSALSNQCQTNTPPGNSSAEQQLEKKYGLLFRYALMTILKSTQQPVQRGPNIECHIVRMAFYDMLC